MRLLLKQQQLELVEYWGLLKLFGLEPVEDQPELEETEEEVAVEANSAAADEAADSAFVEHETVELGFATVAAELAADQEQVAVEVAVAAIRRSVVCALVRLDADPDASDCGHRPRAQNVIEAESVNGLYAEQEHESCTVFELP